VRKAAGSGGVPNPWAFGSNPAKPVPEKAVSRRIIAAADSGAAKLDAQCSSHKSKYLRASASSASPFSIESVTLKSIFFCAAK
jgi:hypothetical protein